MLPPGPLRRYPVTLSDYVRALQLIEDPEAHADAVLNGRFKWSEVTPLAFYSSELVTEEEFAQYYIGVDVDSVIITSRNVNHFRGSAKLQLTHAHQGAITKSCHVNAWVPDYVEAKQPHQMVNAYFADFGQDARLNICFPHLPDAEEGSQRRNMFNPAEIYHFYNNLLYKAARYVLPPSSAPRIPTNHELAVLNSRNEQGQAGRVQLTIQTSELIMIVARMRKMLIDMQAGTYRDRENLPQVNQPQSNLPPVNLFDPDLSDSDDSEYREDVGPSDSDDSDFDQDDYLISMAEWFRDFSFVLIIKGIKDACHIAYKLGEHMDSLNDQLESAIPYIHWNVVESLTKHVAVDYGIEWMPLDRTEQMTLAWYLPHLEDVVKTHGANKIDNDMYCHFPDFGGLRSELS
ncbi:hypothetical protein GGF48_005110, partial [Coemansia sp. RSA 921]